MALADIGLIGLAVMGENLILNMESKGFTVACFNRTVSKVDDFINGRAKGKNIIGAHSIEELVASLKRPHKIMLMVKAGQAVDDFIEKLIPALEPGDVIIDGGNSHFPDTTRRTQYLESKGLYYIGTGVSGGEEGALNGPSMMPGGSPAAWPLVKDIFQTICAHTDNGEPCCDWVGENGAGHFVKMVHNGIEYGDMQMICETYHIMKAIGLSNEEMQFGYRTSVVGRMNFVVTEAVFTLMPDNPEWIRARMAELNAKRAEKQPLDQPSAGSTFKRPEGYFAAALIDQCGLKGYAVGGAQVSMKHAGFLINNGERSSDFLELIRKVQQIVEDRVGVKLEPEIRIIGEEVCDT